MALERLLDLLDDVKDPRCSNKVEHRLTDILVIAVCAVIACAESWDDIALYGRNKLPWLKTFLDLPNGIPSHDRGCVRSRFPADLGEVKPAIARLQLG